MIAVEKEAAEKDL